MHCRSDVRHALNALAHCRLVHAMPCSAACKTCVPDDITVAGRHIWHVPLATLRREVTEVQHQVSSGARAKAAVEALLWYGEGRDWFGKRGMLGRQAKAEQ